MSQNEAKTLRSIFQIKMVTKLSQQLGRSMSLSDVEVECVSLGISIIIFQLLGFILAAIIGLFFNVIEELFIVIFMYIPLRMCVGGFHASKPEYCMLYSGIMFCLQAIGIKYVSWDNEFVRHLIFFSLVLIIRLVVDSKSIIYRWVKLVFVVQTKYAISVLNLMCIAYGLTFALGYYNLMKYIFIGLLTNGSLIFIELVRKNFIVG